MFTDEKTLNTIHADLDASVSHGTMRLQDLIPRYMDGIRDTPEYVQLMNVVPAHAVEDDNAEWWNSEDAISLLEDLEDTLENYAPEGYYFGAHPGDGSDYGYWKMETVTELTTDDKKKFVVTLTMIYNATVEVEATDAKEAVEYVRDNLDDLAPDSLFNKGEKTVDYADPDK